jgi:hypothetical protein
LNGTITLEGLARSAQLKQQAEEAARKAAGIDDAINRIELLPASQSAQCQTCSACKTSFSSRDRNERDVTAAA